MESTSSMEQQFLKKLTDIIDANLHNEQFGVNELATELGMSRITLHRKVKSVVKKSVSEFIREARLKRAYELLQQKTGTVSEIAYNVGFGSVTYFNYSFHKHYGFTPGEVLKGMHPDIEKAPVKNKQSLTQKLRKSNILNIIPIVILFIVVVVQFIRNQDSSSIEKTIAVLPITDENSDENGSLFSYWFGSQIVTDLNKMGDFTVVPYSSVEVYRGSKKENREIAKELMVNYLIRGRTIRTGNQVKINMELIEASSGNSLWSEIFKKEIDENDPNKVFALCDSVVFYVVKKMNNEITPEERVQITKITTENIAALSFYQQGIRHFDLSTMLDFSLGPEFHKEVKKAIQCFKQAIELDSTFSDAYRYLGEIYNQRLYYQADMYLADRYLDTCKIMIEKALYFDENNTDAKKLKYSILLIKD